MSQYQPVAAYLPHRAPMLLLEKVVAVDDQGACCQVRVCPTGVLSAFLTADGDLPGWYALELMAQTAGVWSGWCQRQQGARAVAAGMLLGARDLVCPAADFPAGALLDVRVRLLMRDSQFGSFEGQILCAGQQLASGRINTYQPDEQALQRLFSQS